MDAKPRLHEQVRNQLRTLHNSYRTEQQYLFWARRFILFHGKRHLADMAAAEVEAFLTHLAVDRQVSGSTQNQALAALLFLYQKVLQVELPWLDGIVRAKQSRYLPVVLTPGEVQDVQFEYRQLIVRSGKGGKDRSAIRCRAAPCARTQVSQRAHGVGLAVRLPGEAADARPALGRPAPAPRIPSARAA